MATININVVVNIKRLKEDNIQGMVSDDYIIMTDDQLFDGYMDENESHLITRVVPGDELIWTIKSKNGLPAYFIAFEMEIKTWFTGEPILDQSAKRYTATIAEGILVGALSSYNISFSDNPKSNDSWKFDPFIEARGDDMP